MRDLEQVAIAFDAACREAKVPYAFMGGVAVLAWGQPRTTMDVDALVKLNKTQAETLASALRNHDLQASAADFTDALRDRSHVTAFDSKSPIHVDIKIAATPEELAEISGARDIDFAPGRLRVVRPEDTIAFKLLFGSLQDLADARSILVRQKERLDLAALRVLCKRLKVLAALEAEMKRVGTAP